MSDLIGRQAAIDAVRHAWAKGLEPTQFLEELPSAQPEIVRCKDCEYYKSYTLYGQTQGFCNRLGLQATEIDDFCSRAERR